MFVNNIFTLIVIFRCCAVIVAGVVGSRPLITEVIKSKSNESSTVNNNNAKIELPNPGFKLKSSNSSDDISQKGIEENTEAAPNPLLNTDRKPAELTSQQKIYTQEDNSQKLVDSNKQEKTVPLGTDKATEKLNNADADADYNHIEDDVNENPLENIETKQEDNVPGSIIQPNELPNGEKTEFADNIENGKATMDLDSVLMSQSFENQQEPDVKAYRRDRLIENEDSHFLTYFVSMGIVCGIMYILFHNKKKILALAVEGRRGRHHGGNRRRPNTASYSKLDSNLEEAMVSNVSQASVTHVLY